MLTFHDIKPRDRFIGPDGEVYTVVNVFTGLSPDRHDVTLRASMTDGVRARPTAPYLQDKSMYEFNENDLEWLSSLTHEVFTVLQSPERTSYWVTAECFMDDDRVGSSVYRMGDDICDGGTTNLGTELGAIAAQLDRDSFQIVHNGREARYNKVVVSIEIEHGQSEISDFVTAQTATV